LPALHICSGQIMSWTPETLENVKQLFAAFKENGIPAMMKKIKEAEDDDVLKWVATHLKHPKSDNEMAAMMLAIMNNANKSTGIHLAGLVSAELGTPAKVLEIGFGGGAALCAVLKATKNSQKVVKAFGFDISDDCIMTAKKALSDEGIDASLYDLSTGDICNKLPYADATFDVVYHLNCWYFWSDLGVGLKEIMRVLKPGGVLLTASKMYALKGMFGNRFNVVQSLFINQELTIYEAGLKKAGFEKIGTRFEKPPNDDSPVGQFDLTFCVKRKEWTPCCLSM